MTTTILEQRKIQAQVNTDPNVKYCPICFTKFFIGYTSDGAGGWYNYEAHVNAHSSTWANDLWYEACPYCGIGFHDVNDFWAHVQAHRAEEIQSNETLAQGENMSLTMTPTPVTVYDPVASMQNLPSVLTPTGITNAGIFDIFGDAKKTLGYAAMAYGMFGLIKRRMTPLKWGALLGGLYYTGMLDSLLIKDQSGKVNIPAMLTMAINPMAGLGVAGINAGALVAATAIPWIFKAVSGKKRRSYRRAAYYPRRRYYSRRRY